LATSAWSLICHGVAKASLALGGGLPVEVLRLSEYFSRSFSIGLIAPEFPPDIGGVETYSFELAKALARLGHRVTVFTVPHEGGEVALPGVPVLPLLRQRRRLDRQLLRDYSFDVWHATNAAYAWIALEASNVVISVHGNDFLRPYVEAGRLDLDRLALIWRFRGRASWRSTGRSVAGAPAGWSRVRCQECLASWPTAGTPSPCCWTCFPPAETALRSVLSVSGKISFGSNAPLGQRTTPSGC
jgi:glycosyltransferase involved in cell wall biosynthesis